jgi:hypothetical protein
VEDLAGRNYGTGNFSRGQNVLRCKTTILRRAENGKGKSEMQRFGGS